MSFTNEYLNIRDLINYLFIMNHKQFVIIFTFMPYSQISEIVGMDLRPSPTLTFTKCLELNLQDFIEHLAAISEVAAKEYAIENVSKI